MSVDLQGIWCGVSTPFVLGKVLVAGCCKHSRTSGLRKRLLIS